MIQAVFRDQSSIKSDLLSLMTEIFFQIQTKLLSKPLLHIIILEYSLASAIKTLNNQLILWSLIILQN